MSRTEALKSNQLVPWEPESRLAKVVPLDLHRELNRGPEVFDGPTRDSLTLLVDYGEFLDAVDMALAGSGGRRTRVGLIFVDLRGPGYSIDEVSWHMEDRFLETVGHRIAMAVRSGDIVSRVGDAQFAVLCEDTLDFTGILEVGDRVVESIARPLENRRMKAAVGVAFGAKADMAARELLALADQAKYVVNKKMEEPASAAAKDGVSDRIGVGVEAETSAFCTRVIDDLFDIGATFSSCLDQVRRRECSEFDAIVDKLDLLIREADRVAHLVQGPDR